MKREALSNGLDNANGCVLGMYRGNYEGGSSSAPPPLDDHQTQSWALIKYSNSDKLCLMKSTKINIGWRVRDKNNQRQTFNV